MDKQAYVKLAIEHARSWNIDNPRIAFSDSIAERHAYVHDRRQEIKRAEALAAAYEMGAKKFADQAWQGRLAGVAMNSKQMDVQAGAAMRPGTLVQMDDDGKARPLLPGRAPSSAPA